MNAPDLVMVALPLAVLFLSYSCDRRAVSNQLPTATEVFHLRSECAALGQKILDDHHRVNGLQRIVSRYDPPTNRCYVELTTMLGGTIKELYDGQTRELLASSGMWAGSHPGRSGMVKHGLATLPLPIGDDANFKAAEDFIRKIMADERTQ